MMAFVLSHGSTCFLPWQAIVRAPGPDAPPVKNFRIAVNTRRDRAMIVRSRWRPVCGHLARYFGRGLVEVSAQIRFEMEDPRPDP